jgi:hypothetical protein
MIFVVGRDLIPEKRLPAAVVKVRLAVLRPAKL